MAANSKAQAAKNKVGPNLFFSVIPTNFEKMQGNAAFKSGDYPAAIGHYTSAILADRNDYTFPLNRAAAYLKLGKCVYRVVLRGMFKNWAVYLLFS